MTFPPPIKPGVFSGSRILCVSKLSERQPEQSNKAVEIYFPYATLSVVSGASLGDVSKGKALDIENKKAAKEIFCGYIYFDGLVKNLN